MLFSPLIILGALALILIIAGLLEFKYHQQVLLTIPCRIHVNGTRGKSSVTRLIAAGLRAGGKRTFAKTTGTAPRVIDAQGIDRIIHRLRKPSIGEQVRLLKYFSDENADVVVMECMAVQPQYQWISEHQMVISDIGVITNAPNEKNAKLFIDFLLTPAGQEILLDPKIRRLPVNPKTYSKAPKDFPNPFKDSSIGAAVKFDVQLSKGRYNLVNSLFDVMITYRLDDLRAAMSAIYEAEAKLGNKNNPKAKKLIAEARALVAALPITEAKANDAEFNKIFKKKRKKAKDIEKYAGTRQAEVEAEWDKFVIDNYTNAIKKAEEAIKSL